MDRIVYLFVDRKGVPNYVGHGHVDRPDDHRAKAEKGNREGWRFEGGAGSMGKFWFWMRRELAAGHKPRFKILWEGLDKEVAKARENALIAIFGRLEDGGLLFNRRGHLKAKAEDIVFALSSKELAPFLNRGEVK